MCRSTWDLPDYPCVQECSMLRKQQQDPAIKRSASQRFGCLCFNPSVLLSRVLQVLFGRGWYLENAELKGRDPLDDPFFTRPFGSMFGSSMFVPSGIFFGDSPASGFLEHEASQGPVTKEITSEDEGEEEENKGTGEKTNDPRKHFKPSKEPNVDDPDDGAEERKSKHLQKGNGYNRGGRTQPQTRGFSFQSSSVTYGGANGAYYTSSTTRRTGSDGVILEESKEADTTTGRAAHRISKGIQDKGHSVTRKLNSYGKVDMTHTLHNMNEDELAGFEEAWKGNARKHLRGWNEWFNMHGNMEASSRGQNTKATNGGWVLPSMEQPWSPEGMQADGVRPTTSKGRVRTSIRIPID